MTSKKCFLAIVSLERVFRIWPKLVLNTSGVVLSRYIGPKAWHHFFALLDVSRDLPGKIWKHFGSKIFLGLVQAFFGSKCSLKMPFLVLGVLGFVIFVPNRPRTSRGRDTPNPQITYVLILAPQTNENAKIGIVFVCILNTSREYH